MVKFRWEKDFKETIFGEIPKDWEEKLIKEIGDVGGGSTPSTKVKEYWDGNVAWITPDDLAQHKFRYISHGKRNITEKGVREHSLRIYPSRTVLLTSRAPIGYVAIAKNPVTTNQGFKNIVPNNETNSEYLYYLLKNIVEYLRDIAGGSTFSELTATTLREVKAPFPSSKEQSLIAIVLSYFDSLIENRIMQDEILEKTAMAIFKSWFMDFEPFKDEEFINSDIRKMPKTWQTKKIKEVGEVGGGSTPSTKNKEYWNGEVAWITPKDLADRYTDNFVYISKGERNITKKAVEECSLRLFPPNTVLLTSRAPIGYVAIAENYLTTNQGFKNIIPKDPVYCEFIYFFLKHNVEYLRDIAGGSTFSEITAETLKEVELIIPPPPILLRFHKLVNPLFQKILLNQKEIMVLRRIRDVLLPLLVFGKLRVEEI
jgi:type I restriction enzyme S subunit